MRDVAVLILNRNLLERSINCLSLVIIFPYSPPPPARILNNVNIVCVGFFFTCKTVRNMAVRSIILDAKCNLYKSNLYNVIYTSLTCTEKKNQTLNMADLLYTPIPSPHTPKLS